MIHKIGQDGSVSRIATQLIAKLEHFTEGKQEEKEKLKYDVYLDLCCLQSLSNQ